MNLPTDIVMDVVRAADPAGAESARMALQSARAAGMANGGGFVAEVGSGTGPGFSGRTVQANAVPDSYQRFEAMVLQNFIQTMLPKNNESVYGKGMAGDMWKSLMAEKLADQMAARGGIGIASRLLRDHYVEDGAPRPLGPLTNKDARADLDTQNLLSTALVDEMQRRVAGLFGGDAEAVQEAL